MPKSRHRKNHKKKVILIDRFTESTLAYQHFGMGINKELIFFLNKIILKNIKSDFTFINIVNKSKRILLSTHVNPDGDGLGTELAFYN